MDKESIKRISIMLYRLKSGGAERVMLSLAEKFASRGYEVDVIAFESDEDFALTIPSSLNVIDLAKHGAFDASSRLAKFIKTEHPDVIIANGDRCTLAAYLARRTTHFKPTIITVVHNDLIGALSVSSSRERLLANIKKIPMTYIYPRVERVVAASSSVADSTAEFLSYPREKIRIVYDPVNIDRIRDLSIETTRHPWFDDFSVERPRSVPTVVSVGRLVRAKDFPLLIEAFSIVLDKLSLDGRSAHLAIVGEGPERQTIERAVLEYGISDKVKLLGYQKNPYKFLAKADLLAVSSRFESLPLIITEALAIGTPVVSTDCPSGPAEILGRRSGLLAASGDPHSLADVIVAQLERGRANYPMPHCRITSTDDAVNKYLEVIAEAPLPKDDTDSVGAAEII